MPCCGENDRDPDSFTELQAFVVLNALPHIGSVARNRLLGELGGDPRAVFSAGAARLESVEGVSSAFSAAVAAWRDHFDLPREERRMAQSGTSFVTVRDAAYPKALREIHDPPLGLYRRGACEFGGPAVAIVGSRRATLYGRGVARRLGAELASLGFCVVSGLARGIDTAAHEGALEAGGTTVGVLGTGIDIVYPSENLELYRRIAEGGAILSEFPFGRPAAPYSFAMRNRIVSGLCAAVIVVESDVDGGAMITSRFAGEQGRMLLAVPGRIDQPTSAGCHQLIRDGATLLTSVADVVEEMGYLNGLGPSQAALDGARQPRPRLELTDGESRVLELFRGGEVLAADGIADRAGLPAAEVAAALMMLELKNLVSKRLDGAFEIPG
jgi:DNA processing protein